MNCNPNLILFVPASCHMMMKMPNHYNVLTTKRVFFHVSSLYPLSPSALNPQLIKSYHETVSTSVASWEFLISTKQYMYLVSASNQKKYSIDIRSQICHGFLDIWHGNRICRKIPCPCGHFVFLSILVWGRAKRFGIFLTSSAEHGHCSRPLTHQTTEETLPPGEELQFFPRNKARAQTLAGKEEMVVKFLLWLLLCTAGKSPPCNSAIFITFSSQSNYQSMIGLWQNQPGLTSGAELNKNNILAQLCFLCYCYALIFCTPHHFPSEKIVAKWLFWTWLSADC